MKYILIFLALIPSLAFSQYCPFLGPNQYLPCGVTSTTLTADLSQCGAGSNPNQTTNYNVSQIPYVAQANTGATVALGDDSQAGPFNIGFSFCYYGNTYTQFYIGSNGWISFSAAQPTTFTSAAIPNAGLTVPKNCIMGPWQDWNPGIGGQVRYQLQGVSPCRKLVVSWINVPMYSCTNLLGNFHIVIYESTNYIESHIQNKPSCPQWAGGTAVQGIHNLPGTLAVPVPGRNSTVWTAQNNAWRWTPSGTPVLPTLTWYQVGNPVPIATGVNQITVTPPAGGANYTCHLEYPTCNAGWSTCNQNGGFGPDTVFVSPGPPTLPQPTVVLNDPHCNNGCDGSILITPNGGTGQVSIIWQTGQNGFNPQSLCSGTYQYTLNDAAGCNYNGVATLNNPPALGPAQVISTNPTCFGYCDGSAQVITNGGVAPFTYVWSNGQLTPGATNLCSGPISVQVFDMWNCPQSGNSTLIDPPVPNLTPIIANDTVCFYSQSDILQVVPNANWTYQWTTPAQIISGQGTSQITANFSGLNSNMMYQTSLVGFNQLGCQSNTQTWNTFVLEVVPQITPIDTLCQYDGCQNLVATPVGGQFQIGNQVVTQFCPQTSPVGLNAITYTYNQSGCQFQSVTNIQVNPRPEILSINPDNGVVQICDIDSTVVQFTIQTTLVPDYFWWHVAGDTINTSSLDYWFYEGISIVSVVVESDGCQSLPITTSINIIQCPQIIYYIPNSFTPDGDEYNNQFSVTFTSGFDPMDFHLEIYNRWGEMVWESFDHRATWDGTYNNTPCQSGIYTWKIHFGNPKDDGENEIWGHVNLIR